MKEQLIEAFDYAKQHHTFTKTDIVRHSKNVCVYGLGKYFEDAFFRQEIGKRFSVRWLCDRSSRRLEELRKRGGMDAELILPEKLKEMKDTAVILMLGDPRSAIEQLRQYVSPEKIVTFNDLILDDLMSTGHDEDYYIGQREEMLETFDLLEDEKSRSVYANAICLRIAPHLATASYEELFEEPQYFPADIMKLSETENVADCGAYIGDTLETFHELVGGKCEAYYAFELDPENYGKLQEKAKEKRFSYVTPYPYGVWSKTGDMTYGTMSSSDSYSIYNQRETQRAHVVALDDCLKDKKVSLIKMDIEGAEMEALRGCKKIIKTQSPKMAVCVYHRLEDMWQIPRYLKSVHREYKIYMRHHAKWWVSETVCYGV